MTDTDTHDVVLVHRVFRREFGLLPLMVRGVADGDARRADRLPTPAPPAGLPTPAPTVSTRE